MVISKCSGQKLSAVLGFEIPFFSFRVFPIQIPRKLRVGHRFATSYVSRKWIKLFQFCKKIFTIITSTSNCSLRGICKVKYGYIFEEKKSNLKNLITFRQNTPIWPFLAKLQTKMISRKQFLFYFAAFQIFGKFWV